MPYYPPPTGGAPTDATYITQTSNGTLSAEQALSSLSTGLAIVTTGTGAVSTVAAPSGAVVGTTDTQTLTNKSITTGAEAGTLLHDISATVVTISLPAGHNYTINGGLTLGSGQGVTLTSSSTITYLPNLDFPSLWQTGDVKMISYAQPEPGWLLCDGSAVSRATYATLFGKVGTTWGTGDGSTTFNVPDLRGRSPIGAGTGTAAGATAMTLGSQPTTGVGGEQTHTLTTPEIPAHTHADNFNYHVGKITAGGAVGAGGNTDPDVTGSTGGGGAHNILSPISVVNFVIKT